MSEGPSRLTVTVRLEEKPLHELPELQLRKAPLSIGRILLAVSLMALIAFAVWRVGFAPAKAEHSAAASAIDTAAPLAEQPATQLAAGPAEQEQTQSVTAAETESASLPSTRPVDLTDHATTNSDKQASKGPTSAPSKPSAIREPVQAKQSTARASTVAVSQTAALPEGFSRIVLTTHMHNLEPGPDVGAFIDYPAIKRLYLFTELKGYAGQILEHRWYYRGELKTRATLTIEDSPWRTYSENWLLDDQQGPWRVQIVDQSQKLLFEYSFTYQ